MVCSVGSGPELLSVFLLVVDSPDLDANSGTSVIEVSSFCFLELKVKVKVSLFVT